MTRMITCAKLQILAPGLAQPPYPGELGKKIYDSVSQQAWQQWLDHQTMLINEHRLSMLDPKARDFLKQEMNNFLFGSGSAKPAGFVPPTK
jgi:Fe-S cluster biosynthesis and repair protein YggX